MTAQHTHFDFDEGDGSIYEFIDGKPAMLFAPHPDCDFDEYDDYVLKVKQTVKAVNSHEALVEFAKWVLQNPQMTGYMTYDRKKAMQDVLKLAEAE